MTDFGSEGLLDGLAGAARDARERLLADLLEEGVPLEELRTAVADDTLFLLPAERRVGGVERHSLNDIARLSGLDPDFLADLRRTAGLPLQDRDAPSLTEVDLEAARTTKVFADAGIPHADMLEIVRILGRGLSQAAEAMRRTTLALVFDPEADEHELATRYANVAEALEPLTAPMLGQLLRLHLRDMVRAELLQVAEQQSGALSGARPVAVCFADLVGFTRVGEEVAPDELGAIADHLETMAGAIVAPPVRLVKTIGDAVMLVCADVDALIDAALQLVDRADREEASGFPRLRAGIAFGAALPRAGDWYGRPVNLASRITAIARPGSVVCSQEARDAATADWSWSYAGARRLRNVSEPVRIHRARRPPPSVGE